MTLRGSLALWLIALVFTAGAGAAPISAVVSYGDSLSDSGLFFAATDQPGPPYFAGRFSNGPVAVELLAASIGVPLVNFAFGGATTGLGNNLDGGTVTSIGIPGLPGMAPLYASSLASVSPFAASSLFVVWGGANDFLSPSPLDASPLATADRAVSNLVGFTVGLQAIGAQRILVPGLPDLGLTPFLRQQGPIAAAQASALSDYFNARLVASLPPNVIFFDTAALLRKVVAAPDTYGLTNVTEACLDTTVPSLCANPGEYLFWDDFHPTARTHQILAAEFQATAIPEPATFGVAACVLAFWCVRASRRTARLRNRR